MGWNFTPQKRKTHFPSNFFKYLQMILTVRVVLFSGRNFSEKSDGGHRNQSSRIVGYRDIPILSIRKYSWWFRPKTTFTRYNPYNHSLWEVEENKQEIRKKPVVILCFYYPIIDRIFLHPRWCKISWINSILPNISFHHLNILLMEDIFSMVKSNLHSRWKDIDGKFTVLKTA